jgi:glucose-1-phosphate thymidylyltransferase
LPCSKELLPVGFHKHQIDEQSQPKAISHYLLERMQIANVSKVYIILRKGKWDIPSYFGDGRMLDMHIGYLLMDLPFGVPFTVDQAYPFIKESMVVFGFPDIIFEPANAYQQLLAEQNESNADIVLGLFEATQPPQEDMVDIDRTGRVKAIEIKPSITKLNYTWLIAVWTPRFTNFIHEFVANLKKTLERNDSNKSNGEQIEWFLGDVIKAAIQEKMLLKSVQIPKGRYLDIGTPENLSKKF